MKSLKKIPLKKYSNYLKYYSRKFRELATEKIKGILIYITINFVEEGYDIGIRREDPLAKLDERLRDKLTEAFFNVDWLEAFPKPPSSVHIFGIGYYNPSKICVHQKELDFAVTDINKDGKWLGRKKGKFIANLCGFNLVPRIKNCIIKYIKNHG